MYENNGNVKTANTLSRELARRRARVVHGCKPRPCWLICCKSRFTDRSCLFPSSSPACVPACPCLAFRSAPQTSR